MHKHLLDCSNAFKMSNFCDIHSVEFWYWANNNQIEVAENQLSTLKITEKMSDDRWHAYFSCKNCKNEYYTIISEYNREMPCGKCNTRNSPYNQVKQSWFQFMFKFSDFCVFYSFILITVTLRWPFAFVWAWTEIKMCLHFGAIANKNNHSYHRSNLIFCQNEMNKNYYLAKRQKTNAFLFYCKWLFYKIYASLKEKNVADGKM